MNTKLIPTLLAVTVLVAGIFAFAPIDQASTVHTTGTITTAGGVTLDSAEDLTARTVTGNGNDIIITIGTDNDTTFVVTQVLACGATAVNGGADLSVRELTIDDDRILTEGQGLLDPVSIAVGSDVQSCGDILIRWNLQSDGEHGLVFASDGGDIVIGLDGAIAGDTLTSVKVFGLVQSGANLTVVSELE